MAPSVFDDPPESPLLGDATVVCSGGDNSCDDTFDCGDTASLTLDISRSSSDSMDDEDEGDGNNDSMLFEPTEDPQILKIIGGTDEEAAKAIKMMWQEASNDSWGVKELRPIQEEALMHICQHQSLLLVARTGIGKTHIVRMVGTIFGGIVVVVVPLLALMGDQMTKMKRVQNNGIEVYNLDQLDEESPGFIEKELIPRLGTMKEGTSSTVFLLTSPHHLTRNPFMVNAIIEAKKRNVIAAFVLDEAHLMVEHATFRLCIPLLGDLLWKHIFPKNDPESWPKIIAMTATMPTEYIDTLQALVGGVPFDPSRCIRPGPSHFGQRVINMEYMTRCSTNPYQIGINKVKDLFTKTENTTACMFATLESKSKKLHEQLEKSLNAANFKGNVIHICGSMDKHTKFTMLQLLNERLDKFNLRGMVSTGAANTGIDLSNVVLVVRCGVPPNLLTFVQERGRLARETCGSGNFLLIGNIASVIEQLWLIHNPAMKRREDEEEAPSLRGMNSALVRESNDNRSSDEPTHEEKLRREEEKYKPSNEQLVLNRQRSLKMLFDVLKFLFLDKGCQSAILEHYLAYGVLREADPDIDRCKHSCPVCTRKRNGQRHWDSIFYKMNKQQLVSFLESRIIQDAFPLKAERDSLTNLLWKANDDWIGKIFRKPAKKIAMHVVESAFLQLIAAEIIVAEYDRSSKELKWILNRVKVEGTDILCYKIDDYWDGINLFE